MGPWELPQMTVFFRYPMQKRVETYIRLVDLSRLIRGMIHHAQEYFVPKRRNRELQQLSEQAIYDRKNTLLRTA